MKIVVFGPAKRTGVLHQNNVVDLSYAVAKYLREKQNEANALEMAEGIAPSNLARLIEGGQRALDTAQQALDHLFGQAQNQLGPNGERIVRPLSDPMMKLHAPRPDNARTACAGGNFGDHAAAMAETMRGKPFEGDPTQEIRKGGFWGFWKLNREFVGPGGELVYPDRCNRLDYEGEIAIVVGKAGRRIPRDRALEHIAGLTIVNDGTVRDWVRHAKFNVTQGKNFDSSGAIGPWMVSADEIGDYDDLAIQTRVNGELRQDDTTAHTIFGFPQLIEYISAFTTLKPGDIVSTGTPPGAGARFDPPRFLKPGDSVEVSSPMIGTLRNGIVDG